MPRFAIAGANSLLSTNTHKRRDVERFLQEDQAMGIYLYGELMLSEDPWQQHLARRCSELSREQMDRSSAKVVAEMLF